MRELLDKPDAFESPGYLEDIKVSIRAKALARQKEELSEADVEDRARDIRFNAYLRNEERHEQACRFWSEVQV